MTPNEISDIEGRWTILDNGCWQWDGAPIGSGYGQFSISGVLYMAHRISWIFHRGDIPEGRLILHTCDNRMCVNPEHLFIGTHSDNTIDMHTKGRAPNQKGDANGNAKLNDAKVLSIRLALKEGKTPAELAKLYNVSWNSIKNIADGTTWGHLQ